MCILHGGYHYSLVYNNKNVYLKKMKEKDFI